MKTVLLGFVIATIAANIGVAHASSTKIGLLPIKTSGSETLLILDGNKGSIKSFAVLDEPVRFAAISKDNQHFYAQTTHFVYQGSVKSGKILKKHQYMDVLEQQPGELINPNLLIRPVGVTSSGHAIYSYNKKAREMRLNNDNALATVEEAFRKPTYLVDISDKSTRHIGDYHDNDNMLIAVDQDGTMISWNRATNSLQIKDLHSGDVAETDGSAVVHAIQDIAPRLMPGIPHRITNDILYYPFHGQKEGIAAFFDVTNNELIHWQKIPVGIGGSYPLSYINSKRFLLGIKECDIGPMPASPDFGKPASYSTSGVAKWQEQMKLKQTEFKKSINEWGKKASDPSYCSITIYTDKEKTNTLLHIENSAYASIINDKYALTRRTNSVSLYDLNDKSLVWEVDTDF